MKARFRAQGGWVTPQMSCRGLSHQIKALSFTWSVPPPHSPAGYWRLAVAPMTLPEGNQYRKHQSGFSTPPQIELEIKQSRRYGERGHPGPSPPGSTSPWPSPTLLPVSHTEVGAPFSLTRTNAHVPLHTSTGAPMLCIGRTRTRTHKIGRAHV